METQSSKQTTTSSKLAELTDESIMPFGKYQGKKMANVPAHYLIWLYDNNKCNKEVRTYIVDNLDVLKVEIKNSKN